MIQNDWNRFINLTLTISENYNVSFSDAKQNLWWQLLADYDIAAIEQSLFKHMQNSSFDPKPADLIKYLQPDYNEMFDRLLSKGGYKNDIEYQTWQSVGYACRTQLKEDVARTRFKAEYIRQVELSKRPKQPMSHRIEQSKPVNIKDQMVDERLDEYKNKSPEEIKEMLANFKINKVK